ncbi:hypothetical protein HYH03_016663 [Edaphochlamys debaryana]|uniref:Uncharacterized protein n=1 Tax=Edaphochlamys debaryana TaxID=47281 RepID=A0A836BPW7_9CHLO|nr:hypothetical protein HYH03_016663 [Edaphochlamys debaryana]|eukprot:KAG2484525.1 hypothetical protein HYH03_016663 [Edaphochlamys debaryana]
MSAGWSAPPAELELSSSAPEPGQLLPTGSAPQPSGPSSAPFHVPDGTPDPGPASPGLKPIQPTKSILKKADSANNSEYKRNISWQDQFGQSLTQVLEFEPSEHADSDYGELEERGCCLVM